MVKKFSLYSLIILLTTSIFAGGSSYAKTSSKQVYPYNDSKITFFGRTYEDTNDQLTYFNWTCSGFEFQFEGTKLDADLHTILVEEDGQTLYPWIAVFVDDFDKPYKMIELNQENGTYTLFDDKEPGTHNIRIVKRTEALHSKTGLSTLTAYGNNAKISPLTSWRNHTIEFIGDSITCGYGNESNNPEDGFQTPQENGWETFAAKTARKLNANFNCVSISGIGVYSNWTPTDTLDSYLLMPEIYSNTDTYLDLIKNHPITPWNFEKFKPELIVVELGTNDLSYLKFDFPARKPFLKEKYIDFLKQVREKNGADVKILCAIVPPIDEVGIDANKLFNDIVTEYKRQTNDPNIDIIFFSPPHPDDGLGGSWHPTVKTHERMSEELTSKIQDWLCW